MVTTFVVVVPPRTALRLAHVDASVPGSDICSFPLEPLGSADPGCPLASGAGGGRDQVPGLGFPLPAASGPYLCTQGVGGHLTHFFPASFHAIDLRCALGTPVLAIGDGVIKEVVERNCCGGIHASNLEKWNGVSLELTCGLLVEYVHTLPGTSRVKEGDRVQAGQVLCEAGDIGFAPEPHLHIELHLASDPLGPSQPLRFLAAGCATGRGSLPFVPLAGHWYTPGGEVDGPIATSLGATSAEGSAVGPPLPPPPYPVGARRMRRRRRRALAMPRGGTAGAAVWDASGSGAGGEG